MLVSRPGGIPSSRDAWLEFCFSLFFLSKTSRTLSRLRTRTRNRLFKIVLATFSIPPTRTPSHTSHLHPLKVLGIHTKILREPTLPTISCPAPAVPMNLPQIHSHTTCNKKKAVFPPSHFLPLHFFCRVIKLADGRPNCFLNRKWV